MAETIHLGEIAIAVTRKNIKHVHLIAPTHSEQFSTLITKHFPTWREARAELNELPLTAEEWNE